MKDRIIEALLDEIDYLKNIIKCQEAIPDELLDTEDCCCMCCNEGWLETPEGVYSLIEPVPFVESEDNYYVYYNEWYNTYEIYCNTSWNASVTGLKYISLKDADKFCERFNKK